MNVRIIYDSVFGNTEKVAQAMGEALSSEDVEVTHVAHANPDEVPDADVIIVGSPTRAFSPTPAIRDFVKRIPNERLLDTKVAAFDTRIAVEETGSAVLKFLVKIFGYAAKPIANQLRKKGGMLAVPPEGFFVEGTEGPLAEGELDRAAEWSRRIVAS